MKNAIRMASFPVLTICLAAGQCLMGQIAPIQAGGAPADSAVPAAPGARQISFNGRELTPEQRNRLETLERIYRERVPDGKYWYDTRSGAVGVCGGPAINIIPAGLDLGGPMPANASGGGTRVFINGRELHPIDVAVLSRLGPVFPGRYWVNANGDFGFERGPRLGNLVLAAQQANAPKQKCITCGMYKPGDLIVNEGGVLDPKTGYTAGPR